MPISPNPENKIGRAHSPNYVFVLWLLWLLGEQTHLCPLPNLESTRGMCSSCPILGFKKPYVWEFGQIWAFAKSPKIGNFRKKFYGATVVTKISVLRKFSLISRIIAISYVEFAKCHYFIFGLRFRREAAVQGAGSPLAKVGRGAPDKIVPACSGRGGKNSKLSSALEVRKFLGSFLTQNIPYVLKFSFSIAVLSNNFSKKSKNLTKTNRKFKRTDELSSFYL